MEKWKNQKHSMGFMRAGFGKNYLVAKAKPKEGDNIVTVLDIVSKDWHSMVLRLDANVMFKKEKKYE
jgi:hypothetical protein